VNGRSDLFGLDHVHEFEILPLEEQGVHKSALNILGDERTPPVIVALSSAGPSGERLLKVSLGDLTKTDFTGLGRFKQTIHCLPPQLIAA
jgi:hypothetical protein